ncbi:MAG: hypothetical protein KIT58_04915 [Planctomycetota bacterium]|nr:hypothetical protein [Planctomycetota bacterium]
MGTGAVARSRGLTGCQLQAILHRRPEITPPVVAGRRVWTKEDLAALDRYLAGLNKRRQKAAKAS